MTTTDPVAALAAALSDPPLPPDQAIHAWGEKARRVLASGWLADTKAAAWDEGYVAGHTFGHESAQDTYDGPSDDPTVNPYSTIPHSQAWRDDADICHVPEITA
jgi:hypothetical protein